MDAVRWDHGDRWSFHCRVSPDIRLGDVVIPRDNRQEASGRGKGAGPGAGGPDFDLSYEYVPGRSGDPTIRMCDRMAMRAAGAHPTA
jgi:hypothetical protein